MYKSSISSPNKKHTTRSPSKAPLSQFLTELWIRLTLLYFFLTYSYDFVKIYVGRRLVRHLTGDDVDDDDNDDKHKCDDKHDKDDEKDISWYFNHDEGLDVKVVTIYGTGEMIRILFSSDASVTKRGFFAKYTVMQGI